MYSMGRHGVCSRAGRKTIACMPPPVICEEWRKIYIARQSSNCSSHSVDHTPDIVYNKKLHGLSPTRLASKPSGMITSNLIIGTKYAALKTIQHKQGFSWYR
jgi:hypothetical protein